MATNAYIFNQYYLDLLKQCKAGAKTYKDRQNSKGKMARDLLRAIKKHYSTFDKMAPEHLELWREAVGEDARAYLAVESPEAAIAFVDDEARGEAMWFADIPYQALKAVGGVTSLHTCWTLFSLLCNDAIDGAKLVDISRKMPEEKEFLEALEGMDEGVVQAMTRLRSFHLQEAKKAFSGFEELENTSLGRLAKEIMEDPEVKELQATLKGGDINIANLFADGAQGGGIAKLMGTVSQRMIQKLMSGELQQETLLQDAMQLAGKMQGMMPGGMTDEMAKIGSMLGGLAGGAGGAGGGGLDMSSLMSMLGGAMGGGGGGNAGARSAGKRATKRAGARKK